MNLLLDTHVLLWVLDGSPKLSIKARDLITDGRNIVFVSAVSAWEISIKKGLGLLELPQGNYINELRIHRFTPLAITTEHTIAVEHLPSHHKDPFDRMLVAQAKIEKLSLVTRDSKIKAYSIPIIDA